MATRKAQVVESQGKVCTKCGSWKEIGVFSVNKRNEDGSVKYRASWCNKCRTIGNRKGAEAKVFRKVDEEGRQKECGDCLKMLPFSEFYPTTRGSAGLATFCKACLVGKYTNLERSRAYGASYRQRHPERWKAGHRLRMFRRRAGVRAASDGTVTDAFLKRVYSEERCFWCEEEIPRERRTLEHVVELSRGGAHSVENITMSCLPCNSSRPNRNGDFDGSYRDGEKFIKVQTKEVECRT